MATSDKNLFNIVNQRNEPSPELAIQPRFRATGQTLGGWQTFEEIKKERKKIRDEYMAVRLGWTISCIFIRVFYVTRACQEQLASLALQQIFPIQILLIFLRFELPCYISIVETSNLAVLLILSCSIYKVPSIQIWQQFLAISRGFVWENFYFSYIPMLQTTNLAVLLILSLFCPKCLRVGRSGRP